MLEAVEDALCLLEVPEVIRCVLLCMLELPEVMRCVLFRTLEAVEGTLCLWRCWRCRRRWR